MNAINRSAVVVIPAQPFLDWLHQSDPTSAHLTLNDLSAESTIYLLSDYDTEEEAGQHLQGHCKEIFEEQLHSCIALRQHGQLIGASKLSSAGLSITSIQS